MDTDDAFKVVRESLQKRSKDDIANFILELVEYVDPEMTSEELIVIVNQMQ